MLKNKKHNLGIKKYVFAKLKIKKDKKIYSFLNKNPEFLQFLIDNLNDKVMNKHFKTYKKLYIKDVKNTVLKKEIDNEIKINSNNNEITNEIEIDSNQ